MSLPELIYSADIEADDINASLIHCMSLAELTDFTTVQRSFTLTSFDEMRKRITEDDVPWIFHNGAGYDKPTLERLLNVKFKGPIIDTLAISWYLFPKMVKHGLAEWGELLGIHKPEVDDWQNLPLATYIKRCQEDVRIQNGMWTIMWRFLMKLYGTEDAAWRCVMHLSFKMEQAAMQQKSKWKLDVKACEAARTMFGEKRDTALIALESVMPQVPVYVVRKRPAKPFKGNGDLSATGIKWKQICEDHGKDMDYMGEFKVINKYKDPNAGSPQQVKAWLTDLGWIPETFEFKRDKETGDVRQIPQVKNKDSGLLCDSIIRMIVGTPELQHLEELSIVKHRYSICDTFLNNVDGQGFVIAKIQGLTNTLRFKHKVCLNLPSTRKPYGELIRGLLTARSDKYELCGSDMSSLEDRTKQHYMWKHDPEYVTDMLSDDFDPHCDIAGEAGIMTTQQIRDYKRLSDIPHDDLTGEEAGYLSSLGLLRHSGKGCNYAATYGAGAETIARAAGVAEAMGGKLHQAYWKRNWSLKAIADECKVKELTFQGVKLKWLWNPVAKLWIYLKTDKDRFSTLNQSTGTFCFDRWVWYICQKRPQLTGQFHDEVIIEVVVGNRDKVINLLNGAMQTTNDELKLNRELGCDVDFGRNYAGIH